MGNWGYNPYKWSCNNSAIGGWARRVTLTHAYV